MWEKTALSKLWRYNTAIKHGIPIMDREFEFSSGAGESDCDIASKQAPNTASAPAATQTQAAAATTFPPDYAAATMASAAQPSQFAWLRDALRWLLLLAGGAAAASAGYMLNDRGEPQPQQQAADHSLMYESPLQYIEDQGGHLP